MDAIQNIIQSLKEADEHSKSTWTECIRSAIFEDLIKLKEFDPSCFEELFYGRTNATLEFDQLLKKGLPNGTNIVVVGEAGVGKSTFLHRMFEVAHPDVGKVLFPILIDFGGDESNVTIALLKLISELDFYFKEIGSPITTLDNPKRENTINYNLLQLAEHLSSLSHADLNKTVLLFIDDLDYQDDSWIEFFTQIQNIVMSTKMSFVLSIRPYLEFKIDSQSDILYRKFIRGSKKIKLGDLSVSRILQSRLAPLIRENEESPIHGLFKRLFRRDSAICRVLRKQYGITNLETLARFEFPFCESTINIIRQITNNNLREVFDIAEAVLRYIFINSDSLETLEEDGMTKYVLPEGALVDIFHTNREEFETPYKLFNLHNTRSAKGNSLHFNVLEIVKLRGVIDDYAYRVLKTMGHRRSLVDDSLKVLEDRNQRMIQPIHSNSGLKGKRKIIVSTEYQISKKGELYIDMAKEWDCYINEFGIAGGSVDGIA